MLSHKLVLRESKNFTSGLPILAPPTIPINHYFRSRNQQNRTRSPILLFHANVFIAQACFKHSNFFKVNEPELPGRNQRNPDRMTDIKWYSCTRRYRTKNINQKSNYELFNCSNISIRYWSWNYRGCWHQTCPPVDFVKGFKLFSFQLATGIPVTHCYLLSLPPRIEIG